MMNRSYGSDELEHIERELHKHYRLGHLFAVHVPCSHRYRVKKGGRKEQQIIQADSNLLDDQTCSVCFKIRCSDDSEIITLKDLIDYVKEKDGDEPNVELIKAKRKFYQWLYERMN
jgi:hypothetical protein